MNRKKGISASAKQKSKPLNPKYAVVRKEGWALIVESSSSYDKAIITLTTAFLGFIFAVIRYPLSNVHYLGFLKFILACLIVSIFCSLLSFWFDQIYGDSLIDYAQKYYIEDKDEYQKKKHWSYWASMLSKIFAGTLFFIGLICFSIFFFSESDISAPHHISHSGADKKSISIKKN